MFSASDNKIRQIPVKIESCLSYDIPGSLVIKNRWLQEAFCFFGVPAEAIEIQPQLAIMSPDLEKVRARKLPEFG